MRPRTAAVLVVALGGFALVIISDFISHGVQWPDIIRHSGLALAVAASVALLEPVLSRWAKEDTSVQSRYGLVDIRRERKLFDHDIAKRIASGEKVKIAATCLNSMLGPYRDDLVSALERRRDGRAATPIRIIVLSPDIGALNDQCVLDYINSTQSIDTILHRWRDAIYDLLALAREYPKEMELQLTPHHSTSTMFILDEHLYVGPYIYGRPGSRSVCYHYTASTAGTHEDCVYAIYEQAFDSYSKFLREESRRHNA